MPIEVFGVKQMRRSRLLFGVLTLAAMACLVVSGPFAAAQSASTVDVRATDGSYPALADLVLAALDGRISSHGLPDQVPQTPFGGPSTASQSVQDDAELLDIFAFTINPHGRYFASGGSRDGFFGDVVRAAPLDEPFVTPIDDFVMDEIRRDGVVAPVGPDAPSEISMMFRDLGLDPENPGVQRWGDQDVLVVGPENDEPGALPSGPWVVWGGRTRTPLPLQACDSTIREFVFGADGDLIWQSEAAPGDIFNGTGTDLALTCSEGWELTRFINVGNNFDHAPTTSHALVTPNGFLVVSELAEFPSATGIRLTGYATDAANPNQPDTTAFFTDPIFPGLASPPPHLVVDVFPDLNGPFTINQIFVADPPFASGSPCGVSEWQGSFDAYFGDLGSDGTGDIALVQFASGQLTTGRWTFGNDGQVRFTTAGGGDNYTEEFVLDGPTGQYTYRPGDTECPYASTVENGWEDLSLELVLLDEPEPVVPDEVEEPASDVGVASDVGIAVDPSPASAPSGDDSGSSSLLWIVGLGLAATAGGVALAKSKSGSGSQKTTSEPELSDDTFLRSFDAEDAEWELSEADYERWKYLQDADATAAWATAQAAETKLQTEIETLVATAMATTNKAMAGYSDGVKTYSGAMSTLLKDSGEIGQIYNEWNRKGGVKDIMWWVDLADAVVGVATLAVKLGTGATKMVVRLAKSADDAADATRLGTAAAKTTDEAAAVAGSGPKLSQVDQIYDGADFVKLDDWLCKLLGRSHIDDWAEALPAAALKLGYRMDLTSLERVMLNQLMVKARLASRGAAVQFDPNALAWLHRMAQQPDFWKNLKLEVALDIDTRVYRLVDDAEFAWLKALAESPEAAKAASRPPLRPMPTLPPPRSVPTSMPTAAPPTSLSDTVVGGGAITLPHPVPVPRSMPTAAPPASLSDTVVGGGAITLPHPAPVPRSVPMSVPRVADAAASPTGVGGLSPSTAAPDHVSGAADAVVEGVKAGTATTQGYQVGVALKWFGTP